MQELVLKDERIITTNYLLGVLIVINSIMNWIVIWINIENKIMNLMGCIMNFFDQGFQHLRFGL